ncbi:MAG: LLM class flavin-dependent oxidoreductase [Polyangiaceae bacterium]|nr:LLM class flavin-dependent oxidoreductase [Polyangiaceae bacterium]
MTPFSVLDLAPIFAGSDAAQSFANSLDLARHAERLGYRRFWLAEHHNMPGIASSATAVVIAHIAGGTSTIRVGAGGVMLPNHSPLVIAEQFGTLASLFPDRIDLGLGRAPGTDQVTARALRRTLESSDDAFPQDVRELQAYFHPTPGQQVNAVPGAGLNVPIWILGSSLFGAQLAAAFGLPYAFASHFAPAMMEQAIALYRSRFKPSAQLDKPYVMLGATVVVADTDAEAKFLATSIQQAVVALRTGRPAKIPAPSEGFYERLPHAYRAILDDHLACSFIGSPDTVRSGLRAFLERTGADELMIACSVFDHAARVRSHELAADVRADLAS